MKDAGKILENTLVPYKKRLEDQRCLRGLFALLPPSLASGVAAARITGKILYVGVDNHALKMEFNYKKPLIKSLLTQLKGITGLCAGVEIDEVKTYFVRREEREGTLETLAYPEPARGSFENRAGDPELAAAFEKIRETIRSAG